MSSEVLGLVQFETALIESFGLSSDAFALKISARSDLRMNCWGLFVCLLACLLRLFVSVIRFVGRVVREWG